MKKSNRKDVRYSHEGKKYSSYKQFMKAVHKSEHIAHNWKVTNGFFKGILLKPIGGRRFKQLHKANKWLAAHYEKIEAERSRARWGGPLY